ncbi:MAG: hypothetical protein ACERKX_04375 [Anaerolineales bacterium]
MTERKTILSIGTLTLGLLIAIFVLSRVVDLGRFPLSNQESIHALTALSETDNASPFWPPSEETSPISAAYNTFTVFLFELMGDSNSTARLIAALSGIGIVLSLVFLRHRLEGAQLLILCAIFAVSPVLLTTSRTAGGAAISVFGLTLTISILISDKYPEVSTARYKWAAAALGLTIVSGVAVFVGLMGLVIAFLLSQLSKSWSWRSVFSEHALLSFRSNLWITLLSMVVIAAGFGLIIGGVQGFSEALSVWLMGWTAESTLSVGTYLISLLLYEPLVLVFGIIGGVRAVQKADVLGRAAIWWAAGAFITGLIYPGRNASVLVWVIVPLGFLSAQVLVRLLDRILNRKTWLEFLGLVSVIFVIIGIAYLFFRGFAAGFGPTFATLDPTMSLMIALALFALAVLVLILFGLGWSWSLVIDAGGAVLVVALFTVTLAAAWRLNFSPWTATSQLLWNSEVTTKGVDLVVETLENISIKEVGRRDSLPIEFGSPVIPSLAWALRDFETPSDDVLVNIDPPPAVLVLEDEEMSVTEANYIGQGFKVVERPAWEGVLPPDVVGWWFLRNAPSQPETWLVLIRADLAYLGALETSAP